MTKPTRFERRWRAPAEPRRSGVLIPSVNFEGESRKSKVNSTDLELVVFPEIHLCGDCDKAVDANDRLRPPNRSTGPRVRALGEAPRSSGCG